MRVVKKLGVWLFIGIISCLTILGPAYANEKEGDLWQKAVQIAAPSQKYAPGKIYAHVEEFNRRGKVTKVEESWIQLTADQNHQIKTAYLKAQENGKDVTDRKNKQLNSDGKNPARRPSKRELSLGNDDLNPFNPKVQKDVFYHPTDRKEVINGQECILYEYIWKKSAGITQKGTAWLDKATGRPLLLKFTLDPKPQYVKTFEATGNFSSPESGLWYRVSGVLEASGGVWYDRFHIKVCFNLSEHWLFEQP